MNGFYDKRKNLDSDIVENQTAGLQKLVVQIEDYIVENDGPAGTIPQIDGSGEASTEVEVCLTFVSNYAEEDVKKGVTELFEDGLIPCLPSLVSRVLVNPASADHLYTLKMKLPASKSIFDWPVMPGFPDFFEDVKRM